MDMKRLICLSFIIFHLSFLAQASVAEGRASAAQVMTLAECIQTGIENNLSIKQQDISIEKSRLGITQAQARLLPVIGAALGVNDNLVNPVTVTGGTLLGNDFPDDITWQKVRSMQYQGSMSLEASLPLLDLTRTTAIGLAREMKSLATLSREKAIETLTVQIARVYYLAQTTQEQARLTCENIQRMNELCAIAEALYERGIVLEIDVTRVRINQKSLGVLQKRYEMLYEQQLNMLRFLMNTNSVDAFDVTPATSDIQDIDANGINAMLPELRINTQQQTIIDRQMRQVRMGYLPRLNLVGSAGYTAFAERLSDTHWFGNAVLGLRLSVPLFDGNEKKHRLHQLRLDADRLRTANEQLTASLNREYSDNLLLMRQNREAYQTQQENYRLAQDVYAVTMEKYKEGIASMTELLQDEIALRSAYTQCLDAQFQYNVARLSLLRLTGNLNELSK